MKIPLSILLFIFHFSYFDSRAQNNIQHSDYKLPLGITAGLTVTAGSHINRIGIFIQGYYVQSFAQINAGLKLYYNFKNLGPSKPSTELLSTVGLLIGFGKQEVKEENPFYSVLTNQTAYENSFAYSYNYYFNHIGTKQKTGTVRIQIEEYSMTFENDLFAKPLLDRFRTGAVLFEYNYDNRFLFGVSCVLWHGQMGKQIKTDSIKQFPNGYMDTTGGKFTNYSHGILNFQCATTLPYKQIAEIRAGIDAEKIRNTVQNKIIHDLAFIPKRWYKRINSHVPMLDRQGNQYLFREDQKIKKSRAYVQTALNPGIFY